MGDGILFFQETQWTRILFILYLYPFLIILYLILAYKVLKRKRSRPSITLSTFYVIMGSGLILNIIYLLATVNEVEIILYLLYFSSSYLMIFSFIFIIIFMNIMLKVDFTNKKYFLIVFFYALGCILIHFFPGGITFTENWTPVYSWKFFILAYTYITFSVVAPTILYSIWLSRKFIDRDLKRKLKMFLIGITELIFMLYGTILFNTWQEPVFKYIYSIVGLFIIISSGLLIYYGIGKSL